MQKIVFEWNGFCCVCHCDVHSEKVRDMLRQPIELLGKGFAVPQKEIPNGGIVCVRDLMIKEEKGAALSMDWRTIVLRASEKNLLKTEMIACLLLQIFLVEGLKQGILAFHGSAVHVDDKNIVLLGESGAGKTTVAFALCEDKGGKLISNDFIALRWQDPRLKIVWDDGTSKMSLRKDVFSSYSEKKHSKDRFLGSENRNYYDLKQLNIQTYESKDFIDEIWWIELSETGENHTRMPDFRENMQRLYLNAMGLITGIHLKLYDHQGNWVANCPYPLEPEELKRVDDHLTRVIHKFGCKELRGDLPFVLTALCPEKGKETAG